MIRWMLVEMEKAPAAVFYERELRERFPEDFERARRQRLIRRVETRMDDGSYGHGLNRPYAVVVDGSMFEAFDDEDPEAEPLELEPKDLIRWRLDLQALARGFQQANSLKGKPGPLDARLFFLGQGTRNSLRTAFVLGLLAEQNQAKLHLASLRDRLPAVYDRTIVACPSFGAAADDLRWLDSIGVCVVSLNPEDVFLFDDAAALAVADMAVARSRGPIAVERAVFRLEGEYWTIVYGGATVRMKDCKGLRHLAHLLKNPGTEFPALALSSETGGEEGNEGWGGAGMPVTDTEAFSADLQVKTSDDGLPVLDEQARQEYRSRIRDLDDKIRRAEKRGDTEQAEKAREERRALQQQLSAAVGLGGRSRSTASAAQRARVNVTKQIQGILRRIASQNAPLGLFLRNAIKTGAACSYSPDHPVEWSF